VFRGLNIFLGEDLGGEIPLDRFSSKSHYYLVLRDRAKITSAFLAGSFGRWLCGSLLTDPLAGYARRSRLASNQNLCAINAEFIFARSLSLNRGFCHEFS